MSNLILENWDQLTEEQQQLAIKQIESNPSLKPAEEHPASIFFRDFKWVKIENFIDSNMATLLYQHTKLGAQRLAYLEELYGEAIHTDTILKDHYGDFRDKQAPGDYSKYGDPIFDALLQMSLGNIQEYTGLNLLPNYTYHRLYTTGTELKRHVDRPSCEISMTLCLGYDVSNVDKNRYPNFDWPMFVKDINGNEMPIHMKPGDALIYRGCEIEHWRDPFIGMNHAQAFFHYNIKDGMFNIINDGRPVLGFPASFRDSKIVGKAPGNY